MCNEKKNCCSSDCCCDCKEGKCCPCPTKKCCKMCAMLCTTIAISFVVSVLVVKLFAPCVVKQAMVHEFIEKQFDHAMMMKVDRPMLPKMERKDQKMIHMDPKMEHMYK